MILVDVHEPIAIYRYLQNERGLEVKRVSLKSGDYVFTNIGIERKTYADYLGSLTSKRLWKQVYLLRYAFERPVLVIEKCPNDSDWDPMERRRIMSSLARIMLMGVQCILLSGSGFSTNRACTEQFLDIIQYLFLSSDKKKPSFKPIPTKLERMSTREITEDMIVMIPTIARKTAKEILLRYPTFEKLVKASVDDFKSIPNVGPKRAKLIYEILHEDIDYRKTRKSKRVNKA